MNLLKLGFYGMVLGLVFGSFVFIVTIHLPFLLALSLYRAGVSSFGIIASVVIIELLVTASLLPICIEARDNFSVFLKEKLSLPEDLNSLNENLASSCGLLAGLTLVLESVNFMFDVV